MSPAPILRTPCLELRLPCPEEGAAVGAYYQRNAVHDHVNATHPWQW